MIYKEAINKIDKTSLASGKKKGHWEVLVTSQVLALCLVSSFIPSSSMRLFSFYRCGNGAALLIGI